MGIDTTIFIWSKEIFRQKYLWFLTPFVKQQNWKWRERKSRVRARLTIVLNNLPSSSLEWIYKIQTPRSQLFTIEHVKKQAKQPFSCDYAFVPNVSISLQVVYLALSSQAPIMELSQEQLAPAQFSWINSWNISPVTNLTISCSQNKKPKYKHIAYRNIYYSAYSTRWAYKFKSAPKTNNSGSNIFPIQISLQANIVQATLNTNLLA